MYSPRPNLGPWVYPPWALDLGPWSSLGPRPLVPRPSTRLRLGRGPWGCVSVWGQSGSVSGALVGLAYEGSLLLRLRGAGLCNKQSPRPWNYGPGACMVRGLRGLIGSACGALSTPIHRQGTQGPVWPPQCPQSPPRTQWPVSLTCHPTPGPL